MKPINFSNEIPATYITVKHKGKERQMRRFGEVLFINKFGQARVIRPAEYLYVNKDGKHKMDFTKNPSRSTGNKEAK